MLLGEIISELRKDYGLTQEDLATKLNVSRSTVANWETGNREIDLQSLVKVANIFNVSCDYLLGRTPIKYNLNLEDKENCEAIIKIYETLKEFNIRKK